MQFLHELEIVPRGIYCGSIGWAAARGRSCFNVAIRTIAMHGGLMKERGAVWIDRGALQAGHGRSLISLCDAHDIRLTLALKCGTIVDDRQSPAWSNSDET